MSATDEIDREELREQWEAVKGVEPPIGQVPPRYGVTQGREGPREFVCFFDAENEGGWIQVDPDTVVDTREVRR